MDIIKEIGMPAMLGQLAEECCELGKAALKYQRILMEANPTPVTPEQALADIREEAQDVQDCLWLLNHAGIQIEDDTQSTEKMTRWEKRIEGKRKKADACNDTASEAEPVRHGHWIEQDDGWGGDYWTCSACRCDWSTTDGLSPAENHMKFCPECGAKMDEEADDGHQ